MRWWLILAPHCVWRVLFEGGRGAYIKHFWQLKIAVSF